MTPLADAQRWIKDVITDPDGVAAALGRPGTAAAELVVGGAGALSPSERLELYSRTHAARLLGCLRESYPALRHALGAELFDDFARDYLRAEPSRSYTLASLGAGWPAYLEATRPDRPPAPRERWPDFLVDLATLERAFFEAYDGPGVEGERLASGAEVPADPAATTVTPVRCLRLLATRFPVAAYLTAARRGADPPLPPPAASFVALSRRDYVVTLTELSAAGYAILGELARGATLGRAAAGAGVPAEPAQRLLREWAGGGLIAEIRAPRGASC